MQRSPVIVARSLEAALAVTGAGGDAVAILPSTLDRVDPLAREVATRLGGGASVVTPSGLGGRLRGQVAWRTVDVRAIEPSTDLDRVILPAGLADAAGAIVACDLDRVAARGPYVLDVAAAYVAPRTRLRLHASRERLHAVAEVDLAVRWRGAIVALTVGGERRFIGVADPIAGELVALALSEKVRADDRSLVGPWEDPIVQRATELHLGVLLPETIDLIVEPESDPVGSAVAAHLALRLGVARP